MLFRSFFTQVHRPQAHREQRAAQRFKNLRHRLAGRQLTATRRDANGWQLLPNKSAGAEQNRLFLAVLQGDSSGLQRDFELQLQGEATQWKLTLIPRSLLLKQVFTQINIDGGELVQKIELLETQGDSTVLRMQDSTSSQPLSDAEQHDFAE